MIRINCQCLIRGVKIIMMNIIILNYLQEANNQQSKTKIIKIAIIKISDRRIRIDKYLKD